MEYLLELNFDKSKYEEIQNIYTEEEKREISTCEDTITSSIFYLRSIGVNNSTIENIMLYDYHILVPGEKYLKKAVSKVNKEQLVLAINSNIEYSRYLKDYL